MNVLMVASDNNPASGAFLSMVKLCELLKEKFNNNVIVVLPKEGKGEQLLLEKNIRYYIVKSYDWVISIHDKKNLLKMAKMYLKVMLAYFSAARIAEIIKKEKIDVVHINTTYAFYGALSALKTHTPFVWHLREMLEEDQEREICFKKWGYNLIGKANCIIAISSAVYNKYVKILPKEKMKLVFNGIDIEQFYNPQKEIMVNDRFKLVYGGGYARKKGIYELASALSLLVSMGINNFELWLIGESNKKYNDYLKKAGLLPFVRQLGYQKDVAQWYRQADIAFSCSAMEAFGRKTVEAMLCGCLMIAANTGGSLDIVKHGETGVLYQQGDPIDLAYRILNAMKNREEMRRIAQNGRVFAYEHFSAFDNAQAVNNVYKSVISIASITQCKNED